MAALMHIEPDIETVFIRYEGHHTAEDVNRVYDELDRNACSHPFVRFFVDLSPVTSHALSDDDLRQLQGRLTVCAKTRTVAAPQPLLLAYYAPTAPAQQVGRICTGRWNLHPNFISITSHLASDCAILLNMPAAAVADRDMLPYVSV